MGKYEVVIIGGGPAGLTAGLYTSRAGLKTLLVERGVFGGQIVNARLVENYPGFPEGIAGFELASLMHQQAVKYGLETVSAEVTEVKSGQPHRILTSDDTFEADTLIIATGSEYRKLGVAGEGRLLGRGISYCATCDGFFFRERRVAVVGGGDTAITDALELSQLASKVYIIHRRDQLRAGQVLQERAFAEAKIEFVWNTVVEEIMGEQTVNALRLRNVKTGQLSTMEMDGVFIATGLKPNSQRFAGIIEVNDTEHVVTNELMITSTPGIFAAGDIRKNSSRQVSTAVGDGATAAISAFRYLREGS